MREENGFWKWMILTTVLVSMSLMPIGYMAWKEHKINNDLIEQSLNGNSIAIEILVKYEKPWRLDERLIYEAIAGNEYAIKVLGLNLKL